MVLRLWPAVRQWRLALSLAAALSLSAMAWATTALAQQNEPIDGPIMLIGH
jgi:hypothetical protein